MHSFATYTFTQCLMGESCSITEIHDKISKSLIAHYCSYWWSNCHTRNMQLC